MLVGAYQSHTFQTPAGILGTFCYDRYYVRYSVPDFGQTAHVWVDRASNGTTDHFTIDITRVADIVLGGTPDEHYTIRASIGGAVSTWEVRVTTEGGCQIATTQTTGTY